MGIGRAIVGPHATSIFSSGDMGAVGLEEPVVEATLAKERNCDPNGGKWVDQGNMCWWTRLVGVFDRASVVTNRDSGDKTRRARNE